MLQIPSKTLDVTLPDGKTVTIREQNGDDDTTLTRIKNSQDNTALAKFGASIIISINPETNAPWTWQDIESLRSNNLMYLLLKSRIFSLGKDLYFSFKCSDCKTEDPRGFEEDLSCYDRDLSKPIPKPGDLGYFKFAITNYIDKGQTERGEFVLSSGKKVRYKYKTGVKDKKGLEMDESEISFNTIMELRELEIYDDGKWLRLSAFNIFTGLDMRELRIDMREHDPIFNIISEVECTNKSCKKLHRINLMEQPDFFFPGAM